VDRLASVLLLRSGQVHLPVGDAEPDGFEERIEVDLAERGWLMDAASRQALSRLGEPRRSGWADWLLATIDADTGADRPHVPLFRRFPQSTPESTEALYVERVLALLLQERDQPCVLCGGAGSVAPVSPCGHLVCRACWDGADYSACPICHRRLDPQDPFLQVTRSRWRPPPGTPLRMRRLAARTDRTADATALRDALVHRATPLAQEDREDLAVLLEATTAPGDLSWLPDVVPARETLALVLAVACARDLSAALPAVVARWSTATDVARTLWAHSGGDPGLVLPSDTRAAHPSERLRPPEEPAVHSPRARVGPFPRPLRRAALAALGRLDLRLVVEDVLRHRTVWKRLGEHLHPFEDAARHPSAAVAFAVLRRSSHHRHSAVGRAIDAAGAAGAVEVVADGDLVRARARTFAASVEEHLRAGRPQDAARLLSTRPGDLLRRLDHLARLTPLDGLPHLAGLAAAAARSAAPLVGMAALASVSGRDEPPPTAAVPAGALALAAGSDSMAASGQACSPQVCRCDTGARPATGGTRPSRLEGRVPGQPRRVFFPRGDVMRAWSVLDRRPLLPRGAPVLLQNAVLDALQARAAGAGPFDVAVVDAALADHPLPTRARTRSPASRTLLRGARVALPPGDTLRLFLHWTDVDARARVDLDLSVLLLDAGWRYLGHCDYTRLRWRRGAVHSGDLTSAPPPLGATEFLDLDLPELRADGVAHVVPIVFSYNDVPFDQLIDAFAGFSLPEQNGALFDAARVALRFDLVGEARVLVPMVVHLADGTLRWADLNVSSAGYGHAVSRYSTVLGHVAEDLELAFGTGRRATLLQLAAVHAAGRADQVWLRHTDGSARRVPAGDLPSLLDAAVHTTGPDTLPDLTGRSILFVAADTLPEQAAAAGPGSLLVSAVGGDPVATAAPSDLLSF